MIETLDRASWPEIVDCQGQGLGRELLRHVLQFARSEGYQSVVLEVAQETPAFRLYLKEGFQLQKEIDENERDLQTGISSSIRDGVSRRRHTAWRNERVR